MSAQIVIEEKRGIAAQVVKKGSFLNLVAILVAILECIHQK